jgi:hypothetical protein
MNVVESTIINVLNYSDSYASFPTQIKPDGYLFEPSFGEEPFAIPVSFSEIRVANSQSNIFREGILRFDPEFEKEVYEKLGIRDWEQILTDREIRKIILTPTKDGLEKIVKITSASLLERVRGLLIMLENSGRYDISLRVKDVVTRRHMELYNNQRKSDIVITATASEQLDKSQEQEVDIEKIKEQLRAELESEMRKEADREAEISKIREEALAQLKEEMSKQMKELEQKHKDELKKAVKEAKLQAKTTNTAE